MEKKKIFESTFFDVVPDSYYIIGNDITKFFVIAKYEDDEYYYLFVLNNEKNRICLKRDTFENLIKIVNILIYPDSDKIYYKRCPE